MSIKNDTVTVDFNEIRMFTGNTIVIYKGYSKYYYNITGKDMYLCEKHISSFMCLSNIFVYL